MTVQPHESGRETVTDEDSPKLKPLFIVGCGRSGTTLLQQALARHGAVISPPETGFFIDLMGHGRAGQRRQVAQINRDLGIELPAPSRRISSGVEARALYEDMARRYARAGGATDAEYFCEKSPRHLLVLGRIKRALPEAKYLLMYRDGRDVALSLSRVPWGPSDLYVNFSIWLRFHRWQLWARRRREFDLLEIRYEDLARRPEETLRTVVDFLGLSYRDTMVEAGGRGEGILDFERGWKGQATDEITTARIDRWRSELTAEQIVRLEAWGRGPLEELGYKLSTAGTAPLPWGFAARVYAQLTAWRLRRLVPLLVKNLAPDWAGSQGRQVKR